MKNIDEFVNESAQMYLNKSQLYLLSIPYAMYKEYGQYKEDFDSLKEEDKDDIETMQKFLDDNFDADRVRISYKKLAPQVQYGIKKICEICLNHESDLNKLDAKLFKEILAELS